MDRSGPSIDELIYGAEEAPTPRAAPAIVGPEDPIGQLIRPRSAVRSYAPRTDETQAQSAIDELIGSLN
jgi:hypothetical protein